MNEQRNISLQGRSHAFSHTVGRAYGERGKVFYGNQYTKVKSMVAIVKPWAKRVSILGGFISIADIGTTLYNEGYFGPQTQETIIGTAGGIAGGSFCAWGFAELGGLIGSCFGGVGAIPGAIIGGFIGGVLGSFGGQYATENVYEYYINE